MVEILKKMLLDLNKTQQWDESFSEWHLSCINSKTRKKERRIYRSVSLLLHRWISGNRCSQAKKLIFHLFPLANGEKENRFPWKQGLNLGWKDIDEDCTSWFSKFSQNGTQWKPSPTATSFSWLIDEQNLWLKVSLWEFEFVRSQFKGQLTPSITAYIVAFHNRVCVSSRSSLFQSSLAWKSKINFTPVFLCDALMGKHKLNV